MVAGRHDVRLAYTLRMTANSHLQIGVWLVVLFCLMRRAVASKDSQVVGLDIVRLAANVAIMMATGTLSINRNRHGSTATFRLLRLSVPILRSGSEKAPTHSQRWVQTSGTCCSPAWDSSALDSSALDSSALDSLALDFLTSDLLDRLPLLLPCPAILKKTKRLWFVTRSASWSV